MVDLCSKWTEAVPIPKMTPRTLIDFCETVFQRWGYPEMVISDNGPTFKSNLCIRYLQHKYIFQYYSPVYHQRANPVERRNQELKKLLRIGCQRTTEDRWDEHVAPALLTLRNRVNAATGVSPRVALLGAPITQPGEWGHPEVRRPVQNDPMQREERLRDIRRSQESFNRDHYPRNERPKVQFRVGDKVLTRNPTGVRTPLGPPWVGPYTVVRVCGMNVYEMGHPQIEEVNEDPMHLPRIESEPDPERGMDPVSEGDEDETSESDTDDDQDGTRIPTQIQKIPLYDGNPITH
ncbi:uncharacterized protein K02A2.6-like [Anoplophora glabripennis]|uniref:uncharacterized protein K02A2.6-like n=1 Tax=Anoplophora glabripennis TaxID=217634 RepID=UPI0008753C8A|nr:uncharacterized protein K02A2.6-like [Anoplophora glabripennis]